MSEPYIGEIRMGGWNFAPSGWAFCDGQVLAVEQNDALFNLIGTTYGGDGRTTFQLPDLQGRVPIHQGTGPGLSPRTLGEREGVEHVTLTTLQLPVHTHPFHASGTLSNESSPNGNVPGQTPSVDLYIEDAPNPALTLRNDAVGPMGGNQPHDNVMPFLAINFVIALFGVFPSQT